MLDEVASELPVWLISSILGLCVAIGSHMRHPKAQHCPTGWPHHAFSTTVLSDVWVAVHKLGPLRASVGVTVLHRGSWSWGKLIALCPGALACALDHARASWSLCVWTWLSSAELWEGALAEQVLSKWPVVRLSEIYAQELKAVLWESLTHYELRHAAWPTLSWTLQRFKRQDSESWPLCWQTCVCVFAAV